MTLKQGDERSLCDQQKLVQFFRHESHTASHK